MCASLIAQLLSTVHPNLLSSNTHAHQPPGIVSHGLEMWTTTDDISLDNMKKSSRPMVRNSVTHGWDIHEPLSMGHITQLDNSHMLTTMQCGSWTGNVDNNSQHLLGQHEKQFTVCGEVFSHAPMGHLVASLHHPCLHTQPPSSTQTMKHGVLWTGNTYRNGWPVLRQHKKQFTVCMDG